MVHFRYGLFMDWHGNQKGHGIEYHLLVIALALVVIVKGAGAFSVDQFLCQHYIAQTLARQQMTRR
jgi:putative oxidoreductase